jgi:hypothetical protein
MVKADYLIEILSKFETYQVEGIYTHRNCLVVVLAPGSMLSQEDCCWMVERHVLNPTAELWEIPIN